MGIDGDWAWVLERRCDECGYEADELQRDELAARARVLGGEWRELLGRGPAVTRLNDGDHRTWTPLHYGCHSRDVFRVFEERTREMIKKRNPPTFTDWNQESEAVKNDYAGQDPTKVAYALASHAGKYADLLDRVDGDDWDKRGFRSDGQRFTVESLARYVLHDIHHHLWDVREQLDG